jgi:photosystem II stability/assembly factor-like uncharacterized protein
MSTRRSLAAACTLLLVTTIGVAARPAHDASPATSGGTLPAVEAFKALEYRSIGPAQGGRVTRVAGIPGDPSTYYAATASGGVWKSIDGGLAWTPIFDDQPTSSVGSISVAPSDPNVVYVGSGEANIRGNVVPGNGIYKSIDAGKNWTRVWAQAGQIGTLIVHPTKPDVAFAAVLGHAFGPNPERGVYRTRDGGATWQRVLEKDADTGASDVAFAPGNPNVVFAGLWQARRRPWELVSGGPGSGLHVSRDGGDTWKEITDAGLPARPWGKIGVAVSASDPRRVYALIEAEQGGLFRSDDGGETWRRASADRKVRQRAWYYSTLTINPANADDVWLPQVGMVRTIDGGRTLEYVGGFRHGDHHDLWVDPQNPRRMIDGNDGGVELSSDGGETWTPVFLPIGQFYHVSADTRVPFRVAGAQQDLGTAQGPSNSLGSGGIAPGDWYDVGGGEAGHVVSKPDDPDIVYAGEYLGYVSRYDHRTHQARNVSAYPENGSGHGPEDVKYRFQWTAPIAVSPHDPAVVYHGGNVLFRTTDGGQTWSAMSGDLTRNDKAKQKWSGGPITGDNTGVEWYCTIFAVAESPKQKGLVWVGSDDGLVHVTRDGGRSWTDVTRAMPQVPEWGTVSLIEPSPFDPATAYVVVDAHRLDDLRPYLYKTGDYGKSWTRLDGGLPDDVYLHAVREDPAKKGQLYVGTDRGVVYSPDDGASWASLQLNLPTVPVHDLVVKGDALVVGTHGRSLWILDDLVPVRAWTRAMKGPALLPVPDATRYRYARTMRLKGAGRNPPAGARIYYVLDAKPKGELTIEILDPQSRVVRKLSSVPPADEVDDEDDEDETARKKKGLPIEPGVQRAVWDLAGEGATKIQRARIDAGDPGRGSLALPGRYTVRLTVDGASTTGPLTLLPDPRVTVAAADLEAQHGFVAAIRDDISRLSGLVATLRSVREQVRSRRTLVEGRTDAADLVRSIDRVAARADEIERLLHNPTAEVTYDILAMRGGAKLYSRMSPLLDWASDGDGAPTQGMREVYASQRAELDALAADVKALVDKDVAALNASAAKLSLGFVVVEGM